MINLKQKCEENVESFKFGMINLNKCEENIESFKFDMINLKRTRTGVGKGKGIPLTSIVESGTGIVLTGLQGSQWEIILKIQLLTCHSFPFNRCFQFGLLVMVSTIKQNVDRSVIGREGIHDVLGMIAY